MSVHSQSVLWRTNKTAPPSEEWVFLPPTVSAPSSKSPPAPSHLPTPTPMMPDDDDAAGAYGPIQLFAAEYFSTALGMPFEVGKTLLQIEYRPRKRFDTTPDEAKVVFEAEEEEVRATPGRQRAEADDTSWTIPKKQRCISRIDYPHRPLHMSHHRSQRPTEQVTYQTVSRRNLAVIAS